MKSKINLVSQLAREIEADIGTRDMNKLFLESFLKSIKSFQYQNIKDLDTQYKQLVHVMSNTKPKFGILISCFRDLYKDYTKSTLHDQELITLTINKIQELLEDIDNQKNLIIKHSEKIDVKNKNILIHDHSHSVHDVLINFKKIGQKFNVIVAEQESEKTHANIEILHEANISFQVVPAYMLSHICDNIDIAFFGALTLKNTLDFVMDPGTHGVISELHLANIPIYNFINTRKFSLWESSKKEHGVFIHKHTRQHSSKPIEYDRIKYSHDRVNAKLFHRVVTNEGIFNIKKLKENFQEKYKKSN
ncbi:hypothetical protein KAI58_03000 [Candidatus Gracilibacteria bacterium]|nr:hypothetical protein [Candidatus Gracilibacteria bacterium]